MFILEQKMLPKRGFGCGWVASTSYMFCRNQIALVMSGPLGRFKCPVQNASMSSFKQVTRLSLQHELLCSYPLLERIYFNGVFWPEELVLPPTSKTLLAGFRLLLGFCPRIRLIECPFSGYTCPLSVFVKYTLSRCSCEISASPNRFILNNWYAHSHH